MNTQQEALRSALLTKHSGDQIKKNEMGGARSTYVGEEMYIQGFVGTRDHLQDPRLSGKII